MGVGEVRLKRRKSARRLVAEAFLPPKVQGNSRGGVVVAVACGGIAISGVIPGALIVIEGSGAIGAFVDDPRGRMIAVVVVVMLVMLVMLLALVMLAFGLR